MDMVEKIAIALHERDQAKEQPHFRIPWGQCIPKYQEELRGDARAALEAMREPTEDMILVNSDAAGPDDQATIADWNAMIDAALAYTPPAKNE